MVEISVHIFIVFNKFW